MNVLLLYFSATGNTQLYSRIMASQIIARGHDCCLTSAEEVADLPAMWRHKPVIPQYIREIEKRVPMERLEPAPQQAAADAGCEKASAGIAEIIRHSDIVGFGSPVYFYRPPAVFESLIRCLPDFRNKPAFSYGTHMEGPITFAENMFKLLSGKGFSVIGHVDDHIIHTEMVPGLPKWIASKSSLKRYLEYRLPKIEAGISGFLDRIGIRKASDSVFTRGIHHPSFFMRAIGRAVELGLYEACRFAVGAEYLKESCTRCGLCIQSCPAGLIAPNSEGYPVRTTHCMYCLRCINICPREAITYRNMYKGMARFKGFDSLA